MLIHIHKKNHCVSLRLRRRRRRQHAMLGLLPRDERRSVATLAVPAAVLVFIPVRVFIPVPYSLRHHLSLD